MKRRIFSVLIALALCLSLLPATALAEGAGTEADPWICGASGSDVKAWLSDDGTLTISGSGSMTSYSYGSASRRPWNARVSEIKNVVIADGVTSIGGYAFYRCTELTSAEIPTSVQFIGPGAFRSCQKLDGIALPSGLTSMEAYVFQGCSALKSITIPETVTVIKANAFESTGLTEVSIPSGVTTIGDSAFSMCASLVKVEIPKSVTTIENQAFYFSPDAEIQYPGTTEEWNNIVGSTNIGITTDKVHTSDSDVTYQVTIVDGGDGFSGEGTYSEGAEVTVSAGTMEGKAFAGWTVTGVSLTEEQAANPSLTFTMPANDVTLTANWAEAVAEANGNLFTDLQEAFDAVATEGSGTVKLLKSVTVDQAVKLTGGTVILTSAEGAKYTLTGSGPETIFIKQNGAALTVENVTVENTYNETDLGAGVKWQGVAIMVQYSDISLTIADPAEVRATGLGGAAISSSGRLKILGGTVIAMGSGGTGVIFNSGTAKVEGGTISGAAKGLNINSAVDLTPADTVLLTGGTFTGTTGDAIFIKEARPNTLGDLVLPGSAIVSADTQRAVDMTGKTTGSGTFTVGCAHASVGTVSSSDPDENGVVTVKATCTKCNQEVTLGTLTMVNDGKTIIYGDQEPTFEVKPSEGLTDVKCKWPGEDTAQPDHSTFTPRAPQATGSYSCEVSFNARGSSATVTLTFTLKVNPLDIANATVTVTLAPEASFIVPYNGQEQGPDVTMVLIGETQFKYTLFDIALVDTSGKEAEGKDAGTYNIKVTVKQDGPITGTVTLTSPVFTIEKAKPAIEWDANGQEYREYTGEPVAPSLTPTVTVAGMTSYDGEAVTYSYATAEGGPYTPGLPTDAGTYYIKAAVPQQKNYTAAETAGTLKLVITKAAAEITTAPTAVNPAYNGKPQALVTAAEATFGEVQYSLTGEDGSWSKEIPTGKNAGEYTVWYKVDETDNYKGVAAASVKAEIGKATVTVGAASQNLPVKNNLEKTYTLDLKPFLPVLPQGQEYGKLTYELTEDGVDIQDANYIDAGTVKLEGTVLTVPVKAVEESEIRAVAFITVTIKSNNFQDIEQIVTVSSTNKTPVTITGVTAAGWTYDGKPHPGYTGTPDTGEYTGELSATYVTWPSADELDGEPKDAGTYRVWLTIPIDDPDYEGEIFLFFTVEQAQVTIKADNKTAYVGEEMPELTYQVSGLAEDESLVTNPTPACTPDMTKAGSYPITISGGEVPAGGNYKADIVYQPGTLTVSEKPAPPKPVDPKPPVDPDELEVKLEVKEGFTEVPPALRALEHLNTPEKLTQVMRTAVTRTGVPSGNTAVYDVSLMVSNDGGRTWAPATAANFPSGGLTVTLPYPAGTDSGYTFTVVHMFTTTAFGKTPGDTESPAVTNTAQGLQFTVTGLSPISVGWKAKTTGGGSSGGGSSSSGGSFSGSGGSRPMASVTVERAEHGKVTSDRSSAGSGSSVTLTVQPDRGYRLESLTVTDSRGNKLQLTDKGGGKYAFTMSGGNVTVKAVFAPLADSGACDGGAACPSRAFTDLKSGAWYHEAVDFVLRNGLMNGYGDHSFKPDRTLTRAQFAQILYNKEGRPAAAGGAPFTDVPDGAWCAPAIAWAAERGIAGGYGGGLFGPDDAITREQLAVMLWRYAGSPTAPDGELAFVDAERIGAHAREALGWAVRTGVMNGKGGGVLDPKGPATRAQTAQMLKNFLENG